jgi:hypothetical protein
VAKSQYDPPVATAAAPANESRILHEIISTASSSLDLDEVLKAVVRLLSDAPFEGYPATGWSCGRRASRTGSTSAG